MALRWHWHGQHASSSPCCQLRPVGKSSSKCRNNSQPTEQQVNKSRHEPKTVLTDWPLTLRVSDDVLLWETVPEPWLWWCFTRTCSCKTEKWDIVNSPSTHSCSMSVSMAATRSPTDRAPNTKSPIKRTFPQCLWMWQPRENRRAWNLARIHRGAFWPTAFPWIWSRREDEKRTVLLFAATYK